MASGSLRVGCSGWQYRDWRGRFYPDGTPLRRWFEHYASVFDTVELNATFYRLPAPETVERWAAAAPPGFLYSVKVGQFGTHRMKLRDPERWLANHLARVELLGDALGPNLVQLPPRWRRDVARLDDFLAACPRSIRWTVELRDPSWFHDDVFDVLHRHGAALCLHDLVADHPVELTAPWTYLRFHGPNAVAAPYRGAYGRRRLQPRAEHLAALLGDGIDVYAYFDNDTEARAPNDAVLLRTLIGRALHTRSA